MPPMELPVAHWILLGVIAFITLILWFSMSRISSRLRNIERSLFNQGAAAPVAPAEEADSLREQKDANREQKRQFQEFLQEDPLRGEMAKKDQFAAFRKWRDEKGLNWRNP